MCCGYFCVTVSSIVYIISVFVVKMRFGICVELCFKVNVMLRICFLNVVCEGCSESLDMDICSVNDDFALNIRCGACQL